MTNNSPTRDRILDAAKSVMFEKGLVGATTKEIARVAAVSEGTLYNHFRNKEQIFLATLMERLPNFIESIVALVHSAGEGEVEDNLRELLTTSLPFYTEALTMGASILADPRLHKQLQFELEQRRGGPHMGNVLLVQYLRAEQQLGRVREDAALDSISYMLLGGVYQYAYWRVYMGRDAEMPDADELIDGMLATVMPALKPERD